MKKISIFIGIFFVFSLMLAPFMNVGATAEEMVFLAENEVIDDAYYIKAAGSAELKGTILGDVLVAGGNINISGEVKGDVLVAGGNIKISGQVDGDIRVAGGAIEISGQVGGNVLAVGGNVILTESSQVEGGVVAFAGNVELRGEIDRNTRVGAGSLIVAGELKDKLRAWVGDEAEGQFVVYPSAVIDGQVVYTSHKTIEVKEGAVIKGEIKRETPESKVAKFEKPDNLWAIIGVGWLVAKLISFLALLLIGLLFLGIAPKFYSEIRERMYNKPWAKIGWGLIWLILTPIVSFLVMLTIIGLPLAGIVLGAYFITLAVVKVFAAYVVGWQVLRWFGVKHAKNFWVLTLGIFLFVALGSIPLVGWLVKCALVIWALGAVIEFKKHELRRYR